MTQTTSGRKKAGRAGLMGPKRTLRSMSSFRFVRVCAPQAVRTETMTRLQEFAKSAPLGRASPEAYAAVKKVFSN